MGQKEKLNSDTFATEDSVSPISRVGVALSRCPQMRQEQSAIEFELPLGRGITLGKLFLLGQR